MRQLVDIYSDKNKKGGFSFLKSVVDILNHDELFSNYIEYMLDPFSFVFSSSNSYFDNNVIYCNPNEVRKFLNKCIAPFLEEQNEADIYNLYYLYSLLHECSHIEQNMYAYFNDSIYPDVNNLYRKYTHAMHHLSLYRIKLYEKNSICYAFERSANINAFLELIHIYKENVSLRKFSEMQYIYYMIDGYENKRKKFISPAESTFKLLGIKEKLDHYDLPFEVLITEGLPVEESLYNELTSSIENKCFSEISFKDFYEKVKKLDIKNR